MLLAALVLASTAWAGKAIPPSPRSYIHNEGVISAAAESRISETLAGLERGTGHQFVVALFSSLDGESLEDYSNKVFRAWKIGGKKGDDGLLFCLYKGEKRWRVEVGYGLEGTITDLEASEIARGGNPSFARGDFDAGVLAVVEGLKARLEGRPARKRADDAPNNDDALISFFILIALLIWIFMQMRASFSPYSVSRRRRGGWGGGWGAGGGFSGGGWGGGGGFSGGGGSSGGGGASGGW